MIQAPQLDPVPMDARIQPCNFFVPRDDLRGGLLAFGPGFQRQRGNAPGFHCAFQIDPFFPGGIVSGAELVQDEQGAWFVSGVEPCQGDGSFRRRRDVFNCLAEDGDLLRVDSITRGQLSHVFLFRGGQFGSMLRRSRMHLGAQSVDLVALRLQLGIRRSFGRRLRGRSRVQRRGHFRLRIDGSHRCERRLNQACERDTAAECIGYNAAPASTMSLKKKHPVISDQLRLRRIF